VSACSLVVFDGVSARMCGCWFALFDPCFVCVFACVLVCLFVCLFVCLRVRLLLMCLLVPCVWLFVQLRV